MTATTMYGTTHFVMDSVMELYVDESRMYMFTRDDVMYAFTSCMELMASYESSIAQSCWSANGALLFASVGR